MELTRTDTIVQFTSGSATAWNNVNVPVPAGAVVIDTVNKIIKEGDGATLFANLPVCLDYNFSGATSGAVPPVGLDNGSIAIADDSLYTPSTAKLVDILASITAKANVSSTQTSQIATLNTNNLVLSVAEGTPDGTIVICNNGKYQPGDKTLSQLISDLIVASTWSTSMHLNDLEWYSDAGLTKKVINQNDLTEKSTYYCKITGFHDTAELRAVDFGLTTTQNNVTIVNSAKEETCALIAALYGGDQNDQYAATVIDSEGNIYCAGWTLSEGTGTPTYHNALIIKYDKDLNTLAQKVYVGSNIDSLVSLCIDNNGNIAAVGYTTSQGVGDSGLVVLLDKDLSVLKSKIFGGTGSDLFYGVTVDLNNNIICVGSTSSEGLGGIDAIIYKLDSNLNILARKRYGGSVNDHFYAVKVDSSNNIYAVGAEGSTFEGALIVKFDNNLNILARKVSSGSTNHVRFRSIDFLSTGEIICSGYTYAEGVGNSDALLIKFDSSLTVLAKKRYGGTGEESFENVVVDGNNDIIIAGYTSSEGAGLQDALLMKFDSSLNIVSRKRLGTTANDILLKLATDADNNIIAAGWSGGSSLVMKVPKNIPAGTVNGTTVQLTIADSNLTYADSSVTFINSTLTLADSSLSYANTTNIGMLGSNLTHTREELIVSRTTAPSKLITAIYSSNGTDQFNDVIIDNAGNIICVGQTTLNSVPIALVVKFNSAMVTISRKLFSSSYSSIFNGVCVDASDNIICAGSVRTSEGSLNDGLTVIFNSALDTVVAQKIYSGVGDEVFYDICLCSDGNFVACGYTTSEGLGQKDGLIVRFSTNLGILARRRYGGTGDDVFNGVAIDSVGNIICVGYTGSEGVNTSGLVIKYAINLSVVLRKFYNSSLGTTTEFNAVRVSAANDIYCAGRVVMASGNKGLMVKMDANLAVTNNKLYGNTVGHTEFSGVALDSDGNMFFVGKTNAEGVGNYDAVMLKLSSAFVLTGKKTYGTFGADGDIMCVTDANKDLIISGYATINGSVDAVLTKVPGSLPVGVYTNKKFVDLALNDSNLILSDDTAVVNNSASNTTASALTATNGTLTLSNASGGIAVDKLVLDAVGNVFKVMFGDIVTTGESLQVPFTLTSDDGDQIVSKNVNINVKTYSFIASIYGGAGSDLYHSCAIDSTGNIITAGFTYSESANSKGLIVKYDGNLNILDKKIYGGPTGDTSFLNVIVDGSNNIIVVGFTLSEGLGGSEGLIIRFDNSLNILARKRYGGANYDIFSDVKIDSAGNIYVIGVSETEGGANTCDWFIIKFDTSLNILARKRYGASGADEAKGLTISSTDEIFVVGNTNSEGSGGYDGFIYKFNTNLDVIVRKVCGFSNGTDILTRVVIRSNGNVIAFGYSTRADGSISGFITEFDKDLNFITARRLYSESVDVSYYINDIEIDSTGGLHFIGFKLLNTSGTNNYEGILGKLDNNFNISYLKKYSGLDNESFITNVIDSTGNVIAVGKAGGSVAGTVDCIALKMTQPVKPGSFSGVTLRNVMISDDQLKVETVNPTVANSALSSLTTSIAIGNSALTLSAVSAALVHQREAVTV